MYVQCVASVHYDQLLTEDEVVAIVTVVTVSAIATAISIQEYLQAHTLSHGGSHIQQCVKNVASVVVLT